MDISGDTLALLLAFVSGILMAVQGALNSGLSKVIGLLETTFVVHITGTILIMLLLFAMKIDRKSVV